MLLLFCVSVAEPARRVWVETALGIKAKLPDRPMPGPVTMRGDHAPGGILVKKEFCFAPKGRTTDGSKN
jgi:hypothetical protein